jgi:hypothetical protein
MRKKVLIGIFCCTCLLVAWAFSIGTLPVTNEKDSPLYARSLNGSIQELLGQTKGAVGNAIALNGRSFASPQDYTVATSACFPTTCGQMTCSGSATCEPATGRCNSQTCVGPQCTGTPTELPYHTCAPTRMCCQPN